MTTHCELWTQVTGRKFNEKFSYSGNNACSQGTLGLGNYCWLTSTKLQDKFDTVQYTLVDCPGHASLIRTIIGGAQIIDLMILVIDIIKGKAI